MKNRPIRTAVAPTRRGRPVRTASRAGPISPPRSPACAPPQGSACARWSPGPAACTAPSPAGSRANTCPTRRASRCSTRCCRPAGSPPPAAASDGMRRWSGHGRAGPGPPRRTAGSNRSRSRTRDGSSGATRSSTRYSTGSTAPAPVPAPSSSSDSPVPASRRCCAPASCRRGAAEIAGVAGLQGLQGTGGAPEGPPPVLVVDQFEELWTSEMSEDDRTAFVDALTTAHDPADGPPPVRAPTIRSGSGTSPPTPSSPSCPAAEW